MKELFIYDAFIEPLKELLQAYTERKGLPECPLCETAQALDSDEPDVNASTGCRFCPWNTGTRHRSWAGYAFSPAEICTRYYEGMIINARKHPERYEDIATKRIVVIQEWLALPVVSFEEAERLQSHGKLL